MRVIIVGDLNPHTRSAQRCRTLRELGADVLGVTTVPLGTLPGISPKPTLWSRVRHRLGVPADSTGANLAVLRLSRSGPNILWADKALTLRPRTLQAARGLAPSVRLAWYSEDDMMRDHNQSRYFLGCLPLFDVVFTTKSANLLPDGLRRIGARRVVFVDKAFDPALHRPMDLTAEERSRFGASVGFVGTFEEERARKLTALAEAGLNVRVWGNGWSAWRRRPPALTIEGQPLYGDDYVRAICATAVNLCFLRKANQDQQTDRSIEIPACGGFMLAERTEEHLRLFQEGTEAAFFDSNDTLDLISQVRRALADEGYRVAVARAGRRRCLIGGYSHRDRLRLMLAAMNSPGAS